MDSKKKVTEAQKRATKKYLAGKERIYVVFPEGTRAKIDEWIYQNGYYDRNRIGEFIRDAVEEKLATKL